MMIQRETQWSKAAPWAAIAFLAGCASPPELPCGCLDLEFSVEAVERLADTDWKAVDEENLASVWPGAHLVPCTADPPRSVGIEAVVEEMKLCCDTCRTCGGPRLAENSQDGLSSISVAICRDRPEDVLSAVKRLVEEAVPEELDAAYVQGWSLAEPEKALHNGYRWRSYGSAFILEASVGLLDDRWFGSFRLTRCGDVPVLENWPLDDGTKLGIVEVEMRERADGRRVLHFSYLSDCMLKDFSCVASESRVLWPRVRIGAERESANAVYLSSENCLSESTVLFFRRNEDGTWEEPW